MSARLMDRCAVSAYLVDDGLMGYGTSFGEIAAGRVAERTLRGGRVSGSGQRARMGARCAHTASLITGWVRGRGCRESAAGRALRGGRVGGGGMRARTWDTSLVGRAPRGYI